MQMYIETYVPNAYCMPQMHMDTVINSTSNADTIFEIKLKIFLIGI